ncbi:hypothetical protein FRB99_006812 [Tulasnella sp. 403]|nr:hypothetical protein FRB99_006812 [Tulasnella sp. 403]
MGLRQHLRATLRQALQAILIGAFIIIISLRFIKLVITVDGKTTPARKQVQERKRPKEEDSKDEKAHQNENVSDSADWLLTRLTERRGQITMKAVGGLESDELHQLFSRRHAGSKAGTTTPSSVELASSTNPTSQEEGNIDTTEQNDLRDAAVPSEGHKEPPSQATGDDERPHTLRDMATLLYDPPPVPVAAPAVDNPLLGNLLEQAMPKLVPCWHSGTDNRTQWDSCFDNNTTEDPEVAIVTDSASLELLHRAMDVAQRWNTAHDPLALDYAIHLLNHANTLPHARDDHHANILAVLGHSLHQRFQSSGRVGDIDAALTCFQFALGLFQENDATGVISTLNSLGAALLIRYQRLSEQSDLDQGISTYETLFSKTHPDPVMVHRYRINYGSALLLRYERKGNESDLDSAVKTFEMVIAALPPGDPALPAALIQAGQALSLRFRSPGDVTFLNRAISYMEEAHRTRAADAPKSPDDLSELGSTLLVRYRVLGRSGDLSRAVELLQRALQGMQPGRPDRPTVLNLANALAMRHQENGDSHDMDNAIGLYREALSTQMPRGDQRALLLVNLGSVLLSRFYDSGNLDDIQNSIDHLQEALSLKKRGDEDRPGYLSNLGRALQARYRQSRKRSDLDSAIAYHQECIDVTPPDHEDRHWLYHNLSTALNMRYVETKSMSDLDSAISLSEKALSSCPLDHPMRSSILHSLAEPISVRFSITGDWNDLAKLIKCRQEAAKTCPRQHPKRPELLAAYAHALLQKHQLYSRQGLKSLPQDMALNVNDLEDTIMGLLEEASGSTTSPYGDRLHASCQWITTARAFKRQLSPLARRRILDLLDTTLSRSYSLASRHQLLSAAGDAKNAKDVIINAAAWTMQDGHLGDALEFLERGRAVLLAQMSRYRIDLARLHEAKPHLAERYASLSRQMERFAIGDIRQMPISGGPQPYKDEVTRYRMLSSEWDRTVQEIRAVDGFSRFLEPTSLGTLLSATEAGPIIFVNIGRFRSDALIAAKNGILHLVPLPAATPRAVQSLSERLMMHVRNRREREISMILKEIWEIIVEPIVDVLQDKLALPRKSRIWWCTSAAASRLPLHAAGNYARKDQNLFDLYTSSYTTTMNALVQARSSVAASPPGVPSMLVRKKYGM